MSRTIALIDPLSSARYLSSEFSNFGVRTIAIFTQSGSDTSSYLKVGRELFDEQIHLKNPSIDEVVDHLLPFEVDYIINGDELSTMLTDAVTTRILPRLSNNPKTSHLRFDKYYMQEALKDKKMPYIDQIKISSFRYFQDLEKGKINFPCFCKPVNGFCTVGAFKADDFPELIRKIKDAFSNKGPFKFDEYLIQEYIEGREFFVDAFSFEGNHFISSVQRYCRQLTDGIPVLRSSEIVDDPQLWDQCAIFVKKALTATELYNGFSHSELFLTKSGDMKLIEINPRISGGRGYCNKLAASLGLFTQVDILMAALNDNIKESSPLQTKGFARRLYLFNWSNNPMKDPTRFLAELMTLKEYELLNPVGHIKEQSEKNVTQIDLFVLLHSYTRELLEADTKRLFEWEKLGTLL